MRRLPHFNCDLAAADPLPPDPLAQELDRQIAAVYEREGAHSAALDRLLTRRLTRARQRWAQDAEGVAA